MLEPTLAEIVRPYFSRSARKTVSGTDKSKAAYVLTKAQQEVLAAAGIDYSEEGQQVTVTVIDAWSGIESVEASVYSSKRSDAARRRPEPRMGRAIIGDWINAGDVLLLATDGEHLFAVKNPMQRVAPDVAEGVVEQLVASLAGPRLEALLPSTAKPAPRTRITTDAYVRSPVVREFVIRRARGRCEFPDCDNLLFQTDSGRPYLEVHHITWLRNGGSDSPENAAALCPSCHRAQHYATDRHQRAERLLAAIAHKP